MEVEADKRNPTLIIFIRGGGGGGGRACGWMCGHELDPNQLSRDLSLSLPFQCFVLYFFGVNAFC